MAGLRIAIIDHEDKPVVVWDNPTEARSELAERVAEKSSRTKRGRAKVARALDEVLLALQKETARL